MKLKYFIVKQDIRREKNFIEQSTKINLLSKKNLLSAKKFIELEKKFTKREN